MDIILENFRSYKKQDPKLSDLCKYHWPRYGLEMLHHRYAVRVWETRSKRPIDAKHLRIIIHFLNMINAQISLI